MSYIHNHLTRRRKSKSLFPTILILAIGIILLLFIPGYLCFIGGVVQIIEGIVASPVDAFDIACGLLRFLMAPVSAWLISFLTLGAIVSRE